MDNNLPHEVPETSDTTAATEHPGSSRREFLGQTGRVAAGVGVAALLGNLGQYALSYAAGGPPIKIGILHSLSGTMAMPRRSCASGDTWPTLSLTTATVGAPRGSRIASKEGGYASRSPA